MIFIPEANKIFQFTSFITGFLQGFIGLCMHFLIHLRPIIYSPHIRNSFFIYLRSCKRSKIILHIKYNTNTNIIFFGSLWFEHNFSSTQMRRLTNPALTRKYIYKYLFFIYSFITFFIIFNFYCCIFLLFIIFFTENIRFERMWLFKSNEFQAHRLKPLSQFSFFLDTN